MLLPMMLLPLPMMLKPTHEFFVVAELQERVQFQTRWSLLMFDVMIAVFLLDPLRLEPQHLHDRQDVVDERFFFQNVV